MFYCSGVMLQTGQVPPPPPFCICPSIALLLALSSTRGGGVKATRARNINPLAKKIRGTVQLFCAHVLGNKSPVYPSKVKFFMAFRATYKVWSSFPTILNSLFPFRLFYREWLEIESLVRLLFYFLFGRHSHTQAMRTIARTVRPSHLFNKVFHRRKYLAKV